jgi:GWxTD domain-containing protein
VANLRVYIGVSFRTVLMAFSGLIGAVTAAAQTPAQRDSIEWFRDSIAAVEDSLELRQLESAMIDVARIERDSALLHVKLGFLAYRLGEITGEKQHYDDAGSEFEWAAELEPEWPYAWYGLGLAELSMGEHSFIALENIRQVLGLDYLSKAAQAFGRAARADPAFADAVVDLAETAMRQRIRPRMELALEAVREAARTEAADVPALQLARGRVERAMGEGDSALVAFGDYLELGGDSGIGFLEVARTLYFVNEPEEAEYTYYEGAPLAHTRDAVALHRQDISWVATPEELAQFDLVPAEDRSAWLHQFWERREAADARAPGERLTEHYRRYFRSLRDFRLVSRHRRYDVVNPYRTEQQVFDDRGVVYMRHGEPDERAVYNAPNVDPNESWMYLRSDGNLLFHFVAHADVQDYKLVESLTDVFGLEASIELQAAGRNDPRFHGLFESRMTMDPVYQRLTTTSAAGQGRVLAEERQMGDRSIGIGTTTDSYRLRFDVPMDARVQYFVLGDSATGDGRVLVVFAVPATSVASQPLGDRVAYPVQMRLVVAQPGEAAVTYVDTLRVFSVAEPLVEGQYLAGFLTAPVPEGDYALRVAIGQPWRGAGEVHTGDSVVVPDFGADSLVMSDLVVGRAGSGLTWATGELQVSLNPLPGYPVAANLQVYYEVHGLERGATYRTRLEVRKEGGGSIFSWIGRLFGGGGPPIALTFEGVAESRYTPVFQTVDISDLKPGQYTLRIVVEDPAGEVEIEREAPLEVVQVGG